MTLRSTLAAVGRALRRTRTRRGTRTSHTAEEVDKGQAQRETIVSTLGTKPPPTFPGQFR
jgi:hypothetical protein